MNHNYKDDQFQNLISSAGMHHLDSHAGSLRRKRRGHFFFKMNSSQLTLLSTHIFQFCKTANADFSFKFDILNMGIITACAYSAVIYIGIRHDKLDNI